MKFFKKNSYEIVRLFLNQFALAVFGIVLVMASRMWKGGSFNWLSLVASIFSILFYLYILYATLLEMGMKHKVKIDNGTLQADKHYGLKIMLFAQVPNFIILILMFFGWLFGYAVASGSFAQGMYGIMQIIMYFLQSMYDGLIGAILPASLLETLTAISGFLVWLAYFLSVIPAILVSWGSYILGLHDKKLFFGHPPTTDR
ncbi:MAG: hypothetical protein PUJ21_02170 [Clostridia bacterium]|nr:hypothetical protein [Clostridia bacterium]MDY6184600.1 hypothetical protein [Eubacteriales bacterium]